MAGFLEVIKTQGVTDSHFMGFLNGPCCLALLDTSLQIVALKDTKGYFQCPSSELRVSECEDDAQGHWDEQNLSCLGYHESTTSYISLFGGKIFRLRINSQKVIPINEHIFKFSMVSSNRGKGVQNSLNKLFILFTQL